MEGHGAMVPLLTFSIPYIFYIIYISQFHIHITFFIHCSFTVATEYFIAVNKSNAFTQICESMIRLAFVSH